MICQALGCISAAMKDSPFCGFHDELAEDQYVPIKNRHKASSEDRCQGMTSGNKKIPKPCLLPKEENSDYCHLHTPVYAKKDLAHEIVLGMIEAKRGKANPR